MPLRPGQVLLFYEVLGPLGTGAMSEVYRARDTRLGRDVALKVLPEHLAQDTQARLRFEREARTLATLNHPNIAAIHVIEEVDDIRFLVLELVPGEDLGHRIERGTVPLEEAFEIARQVAEGLSAAHRAGVVHRDLKPANVVVTPDGRVKVLDFGLAKRLEFEGIGNPQAGSDKVSLTLEGTLLGTIDYMSPEQCRGLDVNERTDVWAFGCLLYELLTGRRIFPADSVADKLAAIARDEPDWGALPGGTPAEVRRLLKECLAKEAARRPPMDDAVRDLGEARIRQAPRFYRLRRALLLVFAVTVVVLGLRWFRGFPEGNAANAPVSGTPLRSEPEDQLQEVGRQLNARWERKFLERTGPMMKGTFELSELAAFAEDFLILCSPAKAQMDPATGRIVAIAQIGEGALKGRLEILPETKGLREFQLLLRSARPADSDLGACALHRDLTIAVTIDGEAAPAIFYAKVFDQLDRSTACVDSVAELALTRNQDALNVGWIYKSLPTEAFQQPMRTRVYTENGERQLENISIGDGSSVPANALSGNPPLLALCKSLHSLTFPAEPPRSKPRELSGWFIAGAIFAVLFIGLWIKRQRKPHRNGPLSAPPGAGEELYKVAGCNNEERLGDVVFVHGLDGDAISTWHPAGCREKHWPSWLGQANPRLGIWSLGYAVSSSAWKGTTMPLADRATHALAMLEADGLGNKPLVFVCHSLGGLLIKQLLRQAQSSADDHWSKLLEQTRGIVFLSTPHAGSEVATWLKYARRLLRPTVTIRELRAHDPQLRELNRWFRNSVEPLGIDCQVYYETKKTRHLLVVNPTTADPGIPGVNPVPVDADHVSICKPSSTEALVYKRVAQFVQRLLLPPPAQAVDKA